MAKSATRQWHVPALCWHVGSPGASGGIANVGNDIFTPLVQSEDRAGATLSTVPDAADEWVVERVIGQYHFYGTQPAAMNAYFHSRIYPTLSDETSVALRDLTTQDDAESDFLWHQIDPWSAVYDGDDWGNWQAASSGNPTGERFMGRFGHVDVRVNRRIRQGESLIWHTQIKGPIVPGDDEFWLRLWVRMLVRTG